MLKCSYRQIVEAAEYIVDNKCTIRKAEEDVMIPRSSLHRYIHTELPSLDLLLYNRVCAVFKRNLELRTERSVRSKKRWKK